MAGESYRDYIVRAILDDQASGGLESIVDTATSLVAQSYEVLVTADVSDAQRQLDSLHGAANNAIGSTDDLSKSFDAMTQAMGEGALGQYEQDIRNVDQAGGGLRDTLSQVSDMASSVSDNAGRMVQALTGLAVFAGASKLVGMTEGFVQEDRAVQDSVDFLRQQLGERSDIALKWAEAGEQIYGASEKTRLESLSALSRRGFTDVDQMTQMAEAAEKIANSAEGRQFGITSASDLVNMMAKGRVPYSLRGLMPELFDEDTLKSTGLDQVQARFELMPEALKKAADKVTPDKDNYNATLREMDEQTDKFKANLGELFMPLVEGADAGLAAIMQFANANPIITDMIGGFMLLGIFAGLTVGGLQIASAASGILTTMLGLNTAAAGTNATAWGVLNVVMDANPVFLLIAAIAVLAVGLAILESRTHALSGAWEVFSKSAIGQDLIATVERFVGLLGSVGGGTFDQAASSARELQKIIYTLFEEADGLYKFLKENGSLDMVLAFSIGGPAGMVTSQLDHIYRGMMDIWTWARGIWDDILTGIMNLPQSILDAMNAMVKGNPASTPAPVKTPTEATEINGKKFEPEGHYQNEKTGTILPGWWIIANAGDLGDEIYNFHETAAALTPGLGVGESPAASTPLPGLGYEKGSGGLGATTGPTVMAGKQIEVVSEMQGYYDAMGLDTGSTGAGTGAEVGSESEAQQAAQGSESGPKPTGIPGYGGVYYDPDKTYKNSIGEHLTAQQAADLSEQFHVTYPAARAGGEITEEGLLYGHKKEPIIPAEIAESSKLQDMLLALIDLPGQPIVSSPEPVRHEFSERPSIYSPLTVQVQIDARGSGADENSIIRKVEDAIKRGLDPHIIEELVEDAYNRATRYYTG